MILLISYICLVCAVYVKNGYYNTSSIILLGVGIVLSYYLYYRRFKKLPQQPERNLITGTGFLKILIAAFFIMSVTRYSLPKVPYASAKIILILLFIAEAVLLVRLKKGNLFLLCGLVLSHNLIYSLSAGIPPIDVYHFISEGVNCILNLQNPYTHIYPQIYGPDKIAVLYGNLPDVTKGIAFQPYTPSALLLSIPGFILGDVRIINILAFSIIPIILYLIIRTAVPGMDDYKKRMLAVVPLFYPVQEYFLFNAWNDVLPCLFLVLFLYFHIRKYRFLSYVCLALMLGLKQYALFFALPLLLLLNFRDYKLYIAGMLFLLAPLAIFAFADTGALTNSLIVFHIKQPFREESLGLATLLYKNFGIRIFGTVPFFTIIALANAAFLFLKRHKNQKLPESVFSSYILFSLFLILSKQSFANYYFVLSVMMYSYAVIAIEVEDKDNEISVYYRSIGTALRSLVCGRNPKTAKSADSADSGS
jgi:hypothetical protein